MVLIPPSTFCCINICVSQGGRPSIVYIVGIILPFPNKKNRTYKVYPQGFLLRNLGKAQQNFLLPLLMMALKNISSITYWVDIALNREHEAITLPFETHKDRAVLNTASIPTKNSSIYSTLFSVFAHESFSSPVGPCFIPAS